MDRKSETKTAYIWDLDGTLLDSYGIIVDSLLEIYREAGVKLDREEVHCRVIATSVKNFLQELDQEQTVQFQDIKDRYYEISDQKKDSLKTIAHAKEVLDELNARGDRNFVFTHKGESTEEALRKLDLFEEFEEIVNSLSGFPRKPAPDALLYLIDKYQLDTAHTFYVGDRTLDMDCAKNAGIRGILYRPENSCCVANGNESFTVEDLRKICEIR